jgi:anaerobic carbon-monoxide dehydrogenase iron sulfur subunit
MNVRAILCDSDLCVGCGRCEMWCSTGRHGSIHPGGASIHVLRAEPTVDMAVSCHQCGACIAVCKPGALKRKGRTGAVTVDEELCKGCGECVAVCPWGAMRLTEANKAEKCELCGGDPLCVKHCPFTALRMADIDDLVRTQRLDSMLA